MRGDVNSLTQNCKSLKEKLAQLDQLESYNLTSDQALALFHERPVDEVTVKGVAVGTNEEFSALLANLRTAKKVTIEESKISADCSAVSTPADCQTERLEVNCELTEAQSRALATTLDQNSQL